MIRTFLKKLNLLILVCLLILTIATTFGDKWLENYTDHVGLWQVCRQLKCSWMDWTPSYTVPFLDWWSCVRAFMVLSVMFTFFAVVFQVLNIIYEKHCHASVVRTCMVFNTIFLMIAMVVFVSMKDENYDVDWALGWCYVIGCFCWCLSFALTIFICLCIKDAKREHRNHPFMQNHQRINVEPVRGPGPIIIPSPVVPSDEKKMVELSSSGSEKKLVDIPSDDAHPGPSGSDVKSEKSRTKSASRSHRSGSKSTTRRSVSRSASRRTSRSASKSSFVSTGKEDYSSGSETASETDATKDDRSYTSESGSYTGSSSSRSSASYTDDASSVANTQFL